MTSVRSLPRRMVRFDDLATGEAFEFAQPAGIIEAGHLSEVVAALEAAQEAAADGLWAVGWVAYEASPAFDPALVARSADPDLPLAWFGLFARRDAVEPLQPRPGPAPFSIATWSPATTRRHYEQRVARIRELISQGDTYQVNFTFGLNTSFAGDAFELYRDLSLAQRGSFGAYIDSGRFQVLSASPELFYERRGRHLTTRPMKGTMPRGRWPEEDAALREELNVSEKDRAENLMIVDLIRNDLGRVARFGSVRVERLFELERYETVWQATSTISAIARPEITDVDVFTALFPSGSVTGAPKPRTTEIIAELESSPRGVYCGAIGFLAPGDHGDVDARFNVAIRTVVLDEHEGSARYGVGGGITWDSTPSGEYEEARHKARVLVERRPQFDLVETLGYDPTSGFRLIDRHLDRMEHSADYFGFGFDREACRTALEGAVAGADRGLLRVHLRSDRTGAAWAKAGPLIAWTAPVRLAVDDLAVSSRDVFLYHKTSRRQVYDEAARRHPEADDTVLVNERHEVTETTIANLLVRLDGSWFTPAQESGCLPGVHRQELLERGEVKERVITLEELRAAEELAVVNSARGRSVAVLV